MCNLPHSFDKNFKTLKKIAQIFVAFSEKLNFINYTSAIFSDSDNQIATLENGHKIRYKKCLIATGGQPKTLEAFTNIGPDHVTTYHNVQDFMKMEALIGAIHYYVSTCIA